MIIDTLSVLDFRVFSGAHKFDLTPKMKRGKQAPIILFGGLNGGGKTTILSALKLALYGKGVLGAAATVSDYHQYLKDCIHRAYNSIAKPSRSAIELTFRYAQHGEISTYHLVRDWYVENGEKIKEGLLISRDGHQLSELTYEQAQSFLNELIPIGVSELFFFDGEKIASLAEETTGDSLRDSINKLLGLDLIDRLDSDLSVLIRTRAAKKASEERKAKISDAQVEYDELHQSLECIKDKILDLRLEISQVNSNLSNIESSINGRGGAWNASREEESAKLGSLVANKRNIESSLHELLSGILPLTITKRLNSRLIAQLEVERDEAKAKVLSDYLKLQQDRFVQELEKNLPGASEYKNVLDAAFLSTFGEAVSRGSNTTEKVHELSESGSVGMTHRLLDGVTSLKSRVKDLVEELHETESAIDSAGENIARAPDDSIIAPLFREQGVFQERLAALNEKRIILVDQAKATLQKMSPISRRLDELNADMAKSQDGERTFALAQSARDVLKEFASRARVQKIAELESQFYSSFNGLARKDDRHLSIKVNPVTFEITLVDDSGFLIRKAELSAGEKQIFAISILEALARTSGRSLPVVIDTPLGRLDSLHRKKLLENYFPQTSHQVVILSTDTEINYDFYESLRASISHSYHLIYNPETRSTEVEEGYFWRWKESV
ncbi:UNVERIFIED_ORG: DNA sulfur modification protein DndD [Pseudomonas poae]